MKLVQDQEFIITQYAKTFADDENVDPLRQTYWLGCYSGDAAPGIENLPPPPFGLIVETPAAVNLHQLWYDTFKVLIRAGLTDFLSYGPRSEELHDVCDWADIELNYLGDTQEPEDDDCVDTWWRASLSEAIEAHELMGQRRTSSCVVLTLCP